MLLHCFLVTLALFFSLHPILFVFLLIIFLDLSASLYFSLLILPIFFNFFMYLLHCPFPFCAASVSPILMSYFFFFPSLFFCHHRCVHYLIKFLLFFFNRIRFFTFLLSDFLRFFLT